MRRRGLVIGLLIMLALVTSGFTYAYWASSVTGNNNTATGTITIGEGDVVSTAVVVGNELSAGELVPAGLSGISQGNPVEYVMLQFSVTWTSTGSKASGYQGTLGFAASNIQIDGSAVHAGLVGITFQIGGTVTGANFDGNGNTQILADGAAVTVWVKVVLSEPATQAAYNAIAGKDITFTGTFTVTA